MTLLTRTTPPQTPSPQALPGPAQPPLTWQRQTATWIVFVAICLIALFAGLKLRRWTWEVTKPIRFGDIQNGFKWGDDAAKNGYLNLYERMKDQVPNDGEWLDYAPLRLLVMRQWGLWARANYPDILQYDGQLNPEERRSWPQQIWKPEPYEFTAPVLRFNTLMEFINAVGVFLLVRLWVIRSAQIPQPWKPWQLVRKYVPKKPLLCILLTLAALLGARYGAPFGKDFLAAQFAPAHATLGAVAGFIAGLLLGATLAAALVGTIWYRFETRGLFAPPVAVPALQPHAPFRGFGRGLIAALLIWFNPAMILSAHGWPTWDMWIIPFYIYGMLFASLDWWFCAGVAIALGAMFKGQQLFVAPVFILWPLLLGRPIAALRWIFGLLLGIGLVASPWLVSYLPNDDLQALRVLDHPALWWVGTVTGAILLIGAMRLWLRHYWRRPGLAPAVWRERLTILKSNWHTWLALSAVALAALITPLVVLWPFLPERSEATAWPTLALAAGLPLLALALPLRRIPHLAAGTLGAALLLCIVYFHGSHAWADCGWLFGTKHWVGFVMGMTSNLPGLFQYRFGWWNIGETVMTIPHNFFHLAIWSWPQEDFPLTCKPFFFLLFVITLLLATVGIAFHARRNDPRFLVAITAPWILFFCLPCQIHERYLLFAAGVGVVAVGESFGMGLMSVFLSIVTWIMTIHVMLNSGRPRSFMREEFGRNFGNKLHNFIMATHPDIAWAVLLCAAIYLYMSLTPSKTRIPRLAQGKN